jgi:hypothetical protein
MNEPVDLLEQRLLAGYRGQASQYERALHLIATHKAEKEWAPELLNILQVLAALDAGMANDKAAWRVSGRVPGAELRTLLDHLAGQIRALAGHVDGQVADLLARKERLVPEMDGFIRQRSMLQAYGQYRQTQN